MSSTSWGAPVCTKEGKSPKEAASTKSSDAKARNRDAVLGAWVTNVSEWARRDVEKADLSINVSLVI